jgi:hypothetical protein
MVQFQATYLMSDLVELYSKHVVKNMNQFRIMLVSISNPFCYLDIFYCTNINGYIIYDGYA